MINTGRQAINLDEPPINDPLTREQMMHMSDIWVTWITNFYQLWVALFSQYGINFPPITSDQRDSIQTPTNGQTIYNTTLGTAQYYKAGIWTSF